eukprot:3259320-Pyramimonas_sp.AAC.1
MCLWQCGPREGLGSFGVSCPIEADCIPSVGGGLFPFLHGRTSGWALSGGCVAPTPLSRRARCGNGTRRRSMSSSSLWRTGLTTG